jgi:hypothetical protein
MRFLLTLTGRLIVSSDAGAFGQLNGFSFRIPALVRVPVAVRHGGLGAKD